MTTQSAQQEALSALKLLYEDREAANIADWVMEHITGKKRIDRIIDKQALLSEQQTTQLQSILTDLATNKPIQYVLGEAWFAGDKFYVNESVLIPRPETEELIFWTTKEIQHSTFNIQTVLDIGTGSGCIPISLKKKLPEVSVTSIDVSGEALQVAKQNAETLNADINFLQLDFLDEKKWDQLPVYDIIVSNPPYIKQSEESNMLPNVLKYEPVLALFVPDEDALLFYRKIAAFAKTHLSAHGMIFLEINEALGNEVVALFENFGFGTELRKDMQERDRMIKAHFKI
jgi:release factor glutamine methyltransferase